MGVGRGDAAVPEKFHGVRKMDKVQEASSATAVPKGCWRKAKQVNGIVEAYEQFLHKLMQFS